MKVAVRYETHHGRVVRCFTDRPANVAASLRAAVERAPDADAIVDGERRITYSALLSRATRLAAALALDGVASGDRVAILLANRLEYPVIVYACAIMGAISVPMSVRQSPDETAFALNQSGATVLFHERSSRLPDEAQAPRLRRRIVVDDDLPLPDATPVTFDDIGEDEPFCLLYTSGTTGRPKGAILTHLGVVHSLIHYREHYGLYDFERVILAAPASHVTGLITITAVCIDLAGCLIMMREFKAPAFLELATRERLTYTLLVPAMYVLLLASPAFDATALTSWRVGGFGGAPMPDATIAALAERLPNLALNNTYGATETSSPAVIMPAEQAAARSRQLGLPVACCDLLVMDDQGREVAAGDTGEIWMAGPMVVPGYWENAEATAREFAGGYWKSGDLGSIDADGFVSIHDRKKDMINRGGFKIYSVEVENALLAHPAVAEAAVVSRPCPVLGERVVAFVHGSAAIGAEALRAHCAEWLSDYKVPEEIHIEPGPLPRNANGKVVKAPLRERAVALAPAFTKRP